MPSNISVHQCFKYIYMFLFYLGVLCFRQSNDAMCFSGRTHLYSYVVRFGLIGGFLGGLSMKMGNPQSYAALVGRLSPVYRMIMVLECVFSLVTYTQVVAAMDQNKHKHMQLAARFRQLDNRMCDDFPGLCWNYEKLVRKYSPNSIAVIVFYFTVGMVYLMNMSNCWCDVHNSILIGFTYSCVTCAPACVSFLHIAQMDLLRIRYRLLRQMLGKQYQQHDRGAENTVLHLIGYYKNYTKLILDINDVFGHVIAAGTFYDFYILTCMTFLMCQKASTTAQYQEYIFIFLFMLPRVYKVLIASVYGYLVKKEQRNCLHKISQCEDHFNDSPVLRAALHDFLHWKMHNNYEITLGKNVRFNLNIAYMVVHGVVNYVIILIQLQFQQNNIANNIKTNNGVLYKDVEILRGKKY